MSYKIEKPEGAPEWFVPGIMCHVENIRASEYANKAIVWYNSNCPWPYVDWEGRRWQRAIPIESWEPMEGEWVAAWDERDTAFVVAKYKCISETELNYYTEIGYFNHIARIIDGLDLRCTPEQLKERTEWK